MAAKSSRQTVFRRAPDRIELYDHAPRRPARPRPAPALASKTPQWADTDRYDPAPCCAPSATRIQPRHLKRNCQGSLRKGWAFTCRLINRRCTAPRGIRSLGHACGASACACRRSFIKATAGLTERQSQHHLRTPGPSKRLDVFFAVLIERVIALYLYPSRAWARH